MLISAVILPGMTREPPKPRTKARPPPAEAATAHPQVARKGVVSRVNKGDLDRVTAYLPLDLGIQLRVACATQRIELSEAIADALRAWLAKHG